LSKATDFPREAAGTAAASDFFTALRGEIDAGPDSPLNARQRDSVAPILRQRDDVITLRARSDPAAADRLSDLYVSYRAALGVAAEK
jgi:hypothetical protein